MKCCYEAKRGGENLHGFISLRESFFKELGLCLGTQALSEIFKGDEFHQRQETPSWLCSWECIDGIYLFRCLPSTFPCWELAPSNPQGLVGAAGLHLPQAAVPGCPVPELGAGGGRDGLSSWTQQGGYTLCHQRAWFGASLGLFLHSWCDLNLSSALSWHLLWPLAVPG